MSQEQRSTISGSVWDIYTNLSQEFKENRMPRVGQVLCFEDGRRFTFCSSVAAFAAGKLVGQIEDSDGDGVVASEALSGQRIVNVTVSGVLANQFQGGYITLEGHGTYKIKSNSATVTGDVVVTLYDPLYATVAAAQEAELTPLRNNLVIAGAADQDNVGFTNQVIPAISGNVTHNYFWAQTAGMGYAATAITPGLSVMPAAAGAIAASDGTLQTVGKSVVGLTGGIQLFITMDQVL